MTKVYVFPGQGSQKKGMGEELFARYSELMGEVEELLGYSMVQLCLENPDGKLRQTQYTQPALYVVNALTYLAKVEDTVEKPDYVAGHSLGEYNALFAAGAFDFLTGLRLVQKRGELMGQVSGSSMAAVVGISAEKIREVIADNGLDMIDIANFNTNDQTVIAGNEQQIKDGRQIFKDAGARYVPLNVSAAFHSRYMQQAAEQFSEFLAKFSFSPLQIPVIANVTAQPYQYGQIGKNLAKQITSSVRWVESVEYLLQKPNVEFVEIGPGKVLTGLMAKIKASYRPPQPPAVKLKARKNLVFLYSGQGSQYYQMGKELYNNDATFRQWMNNCDEIVKPLVGESVVDVIYRPRQDRFAEFSRTLHSHPATFMIGYSLTKVVEEWGIRADALLGYSLGEYIAAAVAGAMSLEQALTIVVEQAKAFERHTAEAVMLAVLDAPSLHERHGEFANTWIAADNFAKHFVVTMPTQELAPLQDFCKQRRITCQKLPTRHGFHSPLLEPAETICQEQMAKVAFADLQIPIVSCHTAGEIAAVTGDHLWQVVRQRVEFSCTLQFLEQYQNNIYLDLGSSGTLATFIKYNLANNPSATPIATINPFGQNLKSMAKAREQLVG